MSAFPFDAVIFDMDGVLVDTEFYYQQELEKFIDYLQISVTRDELNAIVGSSHQDFQQVLVEWYKRAGAGVLEPADAEARYEVWASAYPCDYSKLLNPGVSETLAGLKDRGVRVALASSSPLNNIEEVLNVCGIRDYFEFLVSGEQFKRSKPEPDIYLHAIDRLGLPADRCCCVEDSVYGITAGKRAGLTVIAKREERFGFSQDAADKIVDQLPDLLELAWSLDGTAANAMGSLAQEGSNIMAFNVNALGFGDNVVDRYEHIHTMYPGGNAVNFAVYAKKCGALRAAYMGIFGNDAAAEHVIASLEDEDVELAKCKQLIGENGAARVTVVDDDRVFLGSNEGGIRGDARYVLDRFDLEYMKQFDVVHSGNYCFTERELPKLKAAGIAVSFDFSDDSTDEYYEQVAPFVDYAFLSAADAASEDEIRKRLAWVRSLGPRFVSATAGAEGCIAYDGERYYRQPAKPVTNMKDTMGAGDSFLTSFLMCYLDFAKRGEGGPEAIEHALDFAAGFASTVCGMEGSWGHGAPIIE